MKLLDIIFLILFLASVFVAFWYLFGSSPTFEQGLLLMILTLLIANVADVREMKTKFRLLEKSFIRLSKDFKEHIKHK